MSKTVTFIIHGTFANEAKWWCLGSKRDTTFADHLEDELSRRGLKGTVWKPAVDNGFDYSMFAWSGRNRHRDRIKGAKKLSANINRLAEKLSATPDEPLTVNFIAHSHGGNVVLEAIRRLKPMVRVGRIAMLGTPLVTVKPAFRIARFIFSTVLLTLFLICIIALLIQIGSLIFDKHFIDIPPVKDQAGEIIKDGFSGLSMVSWLFPMLLAYGWMFWMFGNLLDVVWRVFCRIFQPIYWLRGKTKALVYGPSPRKLSRILSEGPILLLTSKNDEAELLLQIGSMPARLYREFMATSFSKLKRLIEYLLLRPFVLGVFLKAAEMLLEVFSLGFSPWKSFLLDFEVAPLKERPYYPAPLLVQQRIDVPFETGSAKGNFNEDETQKETQKSTFKQSSGLRLSLKEVTNEIKQQIQLRHSAYYGNQSVIQRIAEFLTNGEMQTDREIKPSISYKPSGNFWEALLVGNVALGFLFAWIAGEAMRDPIMPYSMALWGYIFPFVILGIILIFYWPKRRNLPPKLWRWFWVIWIVWVIVVLLSALVMASSL